MSFAAEDYSRIIHVDHYGNAMTGVRAAGIAPGTAFTAAGARFERARVFSDVPSGTAFWYENSLGLVEIAVNRGSAAERFGLAVGSLVQLAGQSAQA